MSPSHRAGKIEPFQWVGGSFPALAPRDAGASLPFKLETG